MSQMLKSTGAMGAATMFSRVLGLVREQIYAWFIGTTAVADAFYFALVIPNLFRRLLGEGALTAAFIPIFKEKEKTEGEAEMWRAANAVLSGLVLFAAAVVILVIVGVTIALHTMPLSSETTLMLRLLRWMFPYMLFVCIGAAFIGMLNARGHFFVPALNPALLNVAMISSVFLIAPSMGATMEEQIFGLAIGVLIAGVAQAFFQVPALHREGFRYQWVSPWRDETVRQVVKKMIPGALGVAAFQINVVMTYGLAFFGAGQSTIADFNYAVRLMELPQGVFGVSLATFLLPTLSGLAADKKYDDFRSTLRQGVGYLIFVNLLAAVLLFTLAEPIIRLLFEHGSFSAQSTRDVSLALACLAPGLIAFSLVNIVARAFYALGDITTPMRISVFCLLINLVFASFFLLQLRMGAGGLGLANTLSSIVNLSLLLFALRKKLKHLDMNSLRAQFGSILIAVIAAGLIAWQASSFWQERFGHATVAMRLGEVFVPMTLASLAYFGITLWLKVPSAQDVLALVRRKVVRKEN